MTVPVRTLDIDAASARTAEVKPAAVQGAPRAPGAVVVDAQELLQRAHDAAAHSRQMRLLLADLLVAALQADEATLAGPEQQLALARTRTKELGELFSRAAGRSIRVVVPPPPETSAEDAQAPAAEPVVNVAEHPLVKKAAELFGKPPEAR